MLKMAKRTAKRNAGRSKPGGGFKICSQPLIRVAADAPSGDITDAIDLPRGHGPILFAIARDTHTIFATWHIDWRSVFTKGIPADRQVHLRLIGERGVEKIVAIEPMSTTHYLTTSGLHDSYRVEIGYFQPADTWNSVAMSGQVRMPPQGSAEIAAADLATIPFHLRFEQLANLFEASNDTRLARVVSEFQKRVLNSPPPNVLSVETEILRKLNLSLGEIAAAQHHFRKSDSAKLARRTRALLGFTATSPSRPFNADSSG